MLFADLYVDGVGVTVGLGIGKVAFAHGRNFSFGGLVHKAPLSKTSSGQHGVIQAWALQAIFGATVTVLPDAVKGLNATPAANATARGREHVYVKDKHVPSGGGPGFVTALRAGARCFLDAYAARLVFRPKRLRVALHLRRGDIDEHTQTSIRWVTAECVTRTLGAIRALAPSADFHVFSSVAIYPRRNVWVSKDFDPIRRWGATVHLDHETKHNDDSTDAALLHWANWISADVFLAGSSSFSSAPAQLNPNCVLSPNGAEKVGKCYVITNATKTCILKRAALRNDEAPRPTPAPSPAENAANHSARLNCYISRYGDLARKFCRNTTCDLAGAERHWTDHGWRENRTFGCGANAVAGCTCST